MMRDTPQRRAIRRALREAGRPLTPDEILRGGRTRGAPTLGIATVYRNLKALEEDGWAAPVELPGEVTRYEVAGKPHHHHFLCRGCDGAFDVRGCSDDVDAAAPPGFRVEGHEVILYGVCAGCHDAQERSAP
jgi:Fur family ferric uptake transcriptional regulator